MKAPARAELTYEATLIRGRTYGLNHDGAMLWFTAGQPVRVSAKVAAILETACDRVTVPDDIAPRGLEALDRPKFRVRLVQQLHG